MPLLALRLIFLAPLPDTVPTWFGLCITPALSCRIEGRFGVREGRTARLALPQDGVVARWLPTLWSPRPCAASAIDILRSTPARDAVLGEGGVGRHERLEAFHAVASPEQVLPPACGSTGSMCRC